MTLKALSLNTAVFLLANIISVYAAPDIYALSAISPQYPTEGPTKTVTVYCAVNDSDEYAKVNKKNLIFGLLFLIAFFSSGALPVCANSSQTGWSNPTTNESAYAGTSFSPSITPYTTSGSTKLNCGLWIDGSQVAYQSDQNNNTALSLSSGTLSNGTHTWYFNCTDDSGATFAQSPISKAYTGGHISGCSIATDHSGTYYLDNNITSFDKSPCIDFEQTVTSATQYTLNCQGYWVIGNGTGTGIQFNNQLGYRAGTEDAITSNCNVKNVATGITAGYGFNNVNVTNVTVTNASSYGIYGYSMCNSDLNAGGEPSCNLQNITVTNVPSGTCLLVQWGAQGTTTVSNATLANCSVGFSGQNLANTFTLTNSTIANSSSYGIDTESDGFGYPITFSNDNIFNNNVGIYSYYTGSVYFYGNNIHGNIFGVNTSHVAYSPDYFYNNLLNNTNNIGRYIPDTYGMSWNTTLQSGTRVFGGGGQIGGNYWTNSTDNGYSDTCTDSSHGGFCDSPYDIAGDGSAGYDYLPYSGEYSTNQPPVIYFIETIPAQYPVEGSTKSVIFNISINDPQGYDDIMILNASANMTGETTRTGTCSAGDAINSTAINYSCSINMWFYDASGVWSINIYVEDNVSNSDTKWSSFTYNQLTAWNMTTHLIAFPALYIGNTNVFANNHITIQNIGNVNLSNIEINATDLIGLSYSNVWSAGNFSVNTANTCEGTQLSSNMYVSVLNTTLPRGSSSYENLYFCAKTVPSIKKDIYDTSTNGQWTIRSVS